MCDFVGDGLAAIGVPKRGWKRWLWFTILGVFAVIAAAIVYATWL